MTSETATDPSWRPQSPSEVRVLEGPNLYFAKPAIKVSLELPGFLTPTSDALARLAGARGMRPRARRTRHGAAAAVRDAAGRARGARRGDRERDDPAGRPRPPGQRPRGRRRGVRMAATHQGARARPRVGPVLQSWLDGGDATAAQGALVTQTEPGDRPVDPQADHPRGLDHGHQRQDDDDPAARPHRHDRRSPHGLVLHRRRRRAGRAGRAGRLLRPGRRPGRAGHPGPPARHPRDGPRRHAAQGHGRDPQRRQRRHQRLRRPPRAAGHRHRRPARRGQGDRHQGHQAHGLGRAQRRGPARLGHARRHQGQAMGLRAAPGLARRSARRSTQGGRAITVLDGDITVLDERAATRTGCAASSTSP